MIIFKSKTVSRSHLPRRELSEIVQILRNFENSSRFMFPLVAGPLRIFHLLSLPLTCRCSVKWSENTHKKPLVRKTFWKIIADTRRDSLLTRFHMENGKLLKKARNVKQKYHQSIKQLIILLINNSSSFNFGDAIRPTIHGISVYWSGQAINYTKLCLSTSLFTWV